MKFSSLKTKFSLSIPLKMTLLFSIIFSVQITKANNYITVSTATNWSSSSSWATLGLGNITSSITSSKSISGSGFSGLSTGDIIYTPSGQKIGIVSSSTSTSITLQSNASITITSSTSYYINNSSTPIPSINDNVNITTGSSISIDISNAVASSLNISGSLSMNNNSSLTVGTNSKWGDVTVNSGGSFNMPTTGNGDATLIVYGNYNNNGNTSIWKSNVIITGNLLSPATSTLQNQGNIIVGGNIIGNFSLTGGDGSSQIYAVNPNATVTTNTPYGTNLSGESSSFIDQINQVIYGSSSCNSFKINDPSSNITVCSGGNVSSTITTDGISPTYQWQMNNGTGWNDLANGGNYSGVTTANFVINNTTSALNGYLYRVKVTSGSCTKNGNYITLNIAVPPSISTQPTSPSSVCSGNGIQTASVIAAGTNLSYTWRKSGTTLSNGSTIGGQGTSTLTLTNPIISDAGSYDVIISGASGCTSVTSNTINISVNSSPAITTQPNNQTICSGTPVNFSVIASGAGLTYQWTKGGVNINNANSNTYTIGSTASNDAGNYAVVISGTCAPSITSNQVILTVNTTPDIPSLTTPNQPTCSISTGSFQISNYNSTYIYSISSASGITGVIISGNNITAPAGTYTVKSNANSCTSNDSTSETINVQPTTPTISSQPSNQLDCEGNSVKFKAIAASTGTLTYAWQRKRPTESTFTSASPDSNVTYPSPGEIKISNVGSAQSPDGTLYQAIITDSASSCSIVTNSAVLTVNEITGVNPASTSVTQCYGTNYSFTVTTSYPSNVVSYQWKKYNTSNSSWENVTGSVYSGANTATLSITGGTPAQSGNYQVYMTFHSSGADCNVISSTRSRSITFLPLLTTPVTNITQPNCITATGTVNITTQSSTDVYSFDGGSTFPTPNTNTKSGLNPGNYTIMIKNIAGCTISSSVTINSQPTTPSVPSVGTITQPDCFSNNGQVTLSNLPSGNWVINPGSITGTGSGTTINNLSVGTYNFTVSNSSGCTSSASSNATINAVGKNWNGSVSNDWFNDANWTPPGIPSSSDCVIIPNTGKTISIGNNYNGSPVIATANNLTIQKGGALEISETATIVVTDMINVIDGGSMTIKNSANLIQTNNVTNTGTINVIRNSSPVVLNDYTYWSSPTTGSQTLLNFSPNSIPKYFLSYENKWIYLNAKITTFSKGIGYAILTPKDASSISTKIYTQKFIGTPNNGDIDIQVTLGTGLQSSKLIGNPYPSALNADEFIYSNKINSGTSNKTISGTIYYWTHEHPLSNGTYSPSDYAVYNLSGSTSTTGTTYITTNNEWIASGQGFFVEVVANGYVSFKNSMRIDNSTGINALSSGNTIDNSNFYRSATIANSKPQLEKNRLWLNLSSNSGFLNQILIGYITTATDDFDSGFDGSYFGSGQSALYSTIEDKSYSIQAKALPFNPSDIVTLGFKTSVAGNFTITLNQFDGLFSSNQDIFIEDKLTNKIQNLKLTPYTFSSETGTFNDRFVIRYTDSSTDTSLGTNELSKTDNSLSFSIKDHNLIINSKNISINQIDLFSTTGQLISTKKINDLDTIITDLDDHQLYIARVVMIDGSIVNKKILF